MIQNRLGGQFDMKRKKQAIAVFVVCAVVNLVLFFIKLYVSLSANSVCIFSDAINSLADFLSCAVSAGCMALGIALGENGMNYLSDRIEQLLSFILSVVVAAVGFSFAYSSLERLMYPTPVWFSYGYFFAIALTAAVKVILFFFLRYYSKKTASSVIKVLQTDSLMDACVTSVTLISFVMIKFTRYAVDAFAGIFVSLIIIAGAVRLIKNSVYALLGVVNRKTFRQIKEKAEAEREEEIKDIWITTGSDGKYTAHITYCDNTFYSFEGNEVNTKLNQQKGDPNEKEED